MTTEKKSLAWFLAIRGIVAILFGLALFFNPGISLVILIALFGITLIIQGIASFFYASIARSHNISGWWLGIAEGLLLALLGVVVLFAPEISTLTLLYLIAAWAIIAGIFLIAGSFTAVDSFGEGLLWMFGGILGVLFGIYLIARPGTGALALVTVIGFFGIVSGTLYILEAIRTSQIESDEYAA